MWIFEGNFRIDYSMISNGSFIKDKIPDKIEGSFNCSYSNLTSLEGGPKEVNGWFNCSDNQLTSLEGSPNEIGKSFNCSWNLLPDLKGGPIKIRDGFDCSHNQLTSLKGCPKKTGRSLICYNNKLTSLEYISKEILHVNSSLKIEQFFINSGSYKNNYWEDLLKYVIKENISLEEVKNWPEGFLTTEIVKSSKGLSKFNL